ncbi:GTPase KRas isoform X1 [Passer montanus]|uniref:GTPase KRas isoform X1 n=1 Tax=Passer montanus TaxID=9160 RepID=UPI001960B61F|nr:GTPase KRas isoform X1 [Passer montanus]
MESHDGWDLSGASGATSLLQQGHPRAQGTQLCPDDSGIPPVKEIPSLSGQSVEVVPPPVQVNLLGSVSLPVPLVPSLERRPRWSLGPAQSPPCREGHPGLRAPLEAGQPQLPQPFRSLNHLRSLRSRSSLYPSSRGSQDCTRQWPGAVPNPCLTSRQREGGAGAAARGAGAPSASIAAVHPCIGARLPGQRPPSPARPPPFRTGTGREGSWSGKGKERKGRDAGTAGAGSSRGTASQEGSCFPVIEDPDAE